MKLPIKSRREKEHPFHIGHKWFLPSLYWTKSKPFLENKRATLIHRPRYIDTIRRRKSENGRREGDRWLAIEAYCGSTFTGTDKFTFHDTPPEGRIVCERCEMSAIEAKLPSSDKLAGKHVHVGKVMAIRTCCKN